MAGAIIQLKAEVPKLDFGVVHERSTAHRLAVQLEQGIMLRHLDWNVDCEYDRDEDQLKKTLLGIAGCISGKNTDEVLPDIIVHHRGSQGREHNLVVIELKKDSVRDACDSAKLKLFTEPNGHYRYQMGLYININSGRFDFTWYKDGLELASENDSRLQIRSDNSSAAVRRVRPRGRQMSTAG